MQQLFNMRPELALFMLTKNLPVLMVSYSLVCVIHMVPRNATIEKTTGLLEILFTTPLTLRALVWGRALHIAVSGYGMGLLVSVLNIAVLLTMLGDVSLLLRVEWYYWAFAVLGVPVIIIGILIIVMILALVLHDVRIVMVSFSMLATLLVFLGALFQNRATDLSIMLVLCILGLTCHVAWWILGHRITVEKIITS